MLALALDRQGAWRKLWTGQRWVARGRLRRTSTRSHDGGGFAPLALAGYGEFEEADRLSMEAVQLLEPSDYVNERAEIMFERGEILTLAGRSDEAAKAMNEAPTRFPFRSNPVSASNGKGISSARPVLGKRWRSSPRLELSQLRRDARPSPRQAWLRVREK